MQMVLYYSVHKDILSSFKLEITKCNERHKTITSVFYLFRSLNYTKPGHYIKSFHNPDKVLTLHNHLPLACLAGVCSNYAVSPTVAHLQHYRTDCVSELKKSCNSVFRNLTVKDTTIWRWRTQVVSRTKESLRRMGFIE